MAQLEGVEAKEKRLWCSSLNLSGGGNYANDEYVTPTIRYIPLRYAHRLYVTIKPVRIENE